MLSASTEPTLEVVSSDELEPVAGGGWAKSTAKFVGKRVLGPVAVAWTAYDGVSGYLDARDQGKSVGQSLWQGVKSAAW